MPFVVSTLTTPQTYVDWDHAAADRPGALPLARATVTIEGGSNIPTKALITPLGGVVTQISDETAMWLQRSRVFKQHEKNGFVQLIDDASEQGDAFVGMRDKDASAPLTGDDFAKDGKQPPTFAEQKAKADAHSAFISPISTPENPVQSDVSPTLRETGDSSPGLANRINPAPAPDAPASQAEILLAESMADETMGQTGPPMSQAEAALAASVADGATGQDAAPLGTVAGQDAAPLGTVAGVAPTPSQNSDGTPAGPSPVSLVPGADDGEPRRRARRGVDPEPE